MPKSCNFGQITGYMKSRSLQRLFIIVLLIFFSELVYGQWEIVYEKNDILVYNKPTQNRNCDYMANALINTSIDSLYKFLINFENYPKWVNYCARLDMLQKIPDSLYIYYSFFDMPWPFTNRETISRLLVIERHPNEIKVSVKPHKPKYKSRPGCIWVNHFHESYLIRKISDGKTEITMIGEYDPGGFIPNVLLRKMLKYGPYDILMKIKSYTEY